MFKNEVNDIYELSIMQNLKKNPQVSIYSSRCKNKSLGRVLGRFLILAFLKMKFFKLTGL